MSSTNRGAELAPDIAAVLAGESRYVMIHADCRDVLPTLPDRGVDHVITDPPYDARTHEPGRARSLRGGGSDIPINFAALSDFAVVGDMLRTSARWVLAFCALEQIAAYRDAAGDAWVRAGIWDRLDGTPQISGDRPAQGAEGIAIMHRAGRKHWNGGGSRGMWRCGVERVERFHPTPKPLPLMLALIEQFTDPGDLVLDPFCGSASTGVACLRLGRRFIGIEMDATYAQTARDRLAAEAAHSTLAARRAGQGALFDPEHGEGGR